MIPRRTKMGIFFFILVLFVLGCSQPRPRIETLPRPNPVSLLEKIRKNQAALRDLKGLGVVVMSSPQGKSAQGLDLRYLAPDYLKLSFRGAMGVSTGTVVLAQDRYSVSLLSPYYIQESGFIEDTILLDNFGLPIGKDDLLTLFLPLASVPHIPDSIDIQQDLMEQQYRLHWSDNSDVHALWADPFKPIALRELLFSASADTIWYKEVDRVKKRSGVFVPLAWTVQLGHGEQSYSVQLKLSNLWINCGLSPADFEIKNFTASGSEEAPIGK